MVARSPRRGRLPAFVLVGPVCSGAEVFDTTPLRERRSPEGTARARLVRAESDCRADTRVAQGSIRCSPVRFGKHA